MSKAGTIIYKNTKGGAVQQWCQEIEGSKYRTISGQVNGKLVTSEWTQCEATNEGRANQRTPEEQAIFEVDANYKKKLDKDYHLSIENIDEGAHIFECMLAQDYKKALGRKNPPDPLGTPKLFSQPKLDGMRCIVNKDGMWTRNGKPIVSCPHIFNALKPAFAVDPTLIFDGELYNHEFKANFNEIMSIFKQIKPSLEDYQKAEEFGQYHVYDLTYSVPNEDIFLFRSLKLFNILEQLNSPYLQRVETAPIATQESLDSLYEEYLENGYEGQMVRINAPYENGRTWNLLKRKEFFDTEYELVDIQEGLGNWSGKAKIATLKHPDGRTFGAGITGTMEFCEQLLKNKEKYIGKKTTVNYTNLTPDGIPRFGRCKEFDRMDV